MKIHCTRGCICNCLTVDDENYMDLGPEKRKEVLERIKKYLLSHPWKDYSVDGFLSEVAYIDPDNSRLTEDEETCELFLDNVPSKDLDDDTFKQFVEEFFDKPLNENLDQSDFIVWWFMEDFVGLKYQYTCDECGDSVSSRDIKL